MARIITLGLEAAEMHRRYSAIHGALFGASSFRLLIQTLRGRGREAFAGYRHDLVELLGQLEELEYSIETCEKNEQSTRGAYALQQTLLDYCASLAKVIAGLAGICHNLEKDEARYRQTDEQGRSRFNQDKIRYDYAISELENLGVKLNRLFSSY
jgi:hypothetical protein